MTHRRRFRRRRTFAVVALLTGALLPAACGPSPPAPAQPAAAAPHAQQARHAPSGPRADGFPAGCARRKQIDTSGFTTVGKGIAPWPPQSSLADIAARWDGIGRRMVASLALDRPTVSGKLSGDWVRAQLSKAALLHFDGDADAAAATLAALRSDVLADDGLAREWIATIVYFQGVTAMRRAENANCVDCAGVASCILPVEPEAVHAVREGAAEAVRHFTDVLEAGARDGLPEDLEVQWLLAVAHMTLGDWPAGVDPRFRLPLEGFLEDRRDFLRFENVGRAAGLDRTNEAGGAILEDFDGDGLLDVVVSSMDPRQSLGVFRNRGDGTFEDRTREAGVADQLGGLYCVQTDYDGDGHADVFVVRGAWLLAPIRPSLLRNRGDGTFEDVTVAAGLDAPLNANSASWADFDGDGRLDVFVPCERQPNRLYRNRGDGTFEDVAARAGVAGDGPMAKGATWIDHDDDGRPDLFVNVLGGRAALHRNQGDGTFRDVTREAGIDGPLHGFSCWAFDHDNDGRLDIFATCYERSPAAIVQGLLGRPHGLGRGRLWRNVDGRRFEDVTARAGLDGVYAAMGSNFADFDGDGFLDVYLSTGDPQIATLVPNRMFRNDGGVRFTDVTSASRTGHLQKGHAVACGDWDRDGDVDLFVQLGGAVPGDRFRNALFRNPGAADPARAHRWVTLKLVGVKSNRAAIGARIRIETAGERPQTLHRHVSTGSSFGANPLEQTIGLGRADRIATLEVRWPTSGTTQVFHDVPVDRRIEVTEFAETWRTVPTTPVPATPVSTTTASTPR